MKHFRPSKAAPAIYLYRDFVDFRKSYPRLEAIVEQELGRSLFSGELYVFTNRHRNNIKCLYWEDNGFVLYYKSLAEGKFKWPKGDDISLLKPHKNCIFTPCSSDFLQ